MDRSHRDLLRKIEHADAFPLIALQAIRDFRPELDSAEARAILRARELGASLSEIADAMNISRQGVAYKLKKIEAKKTDVAQLSELEASPQDA
jgi:DNA-binding CsgD family transcriptional regulator